MVVVSLLAMNNRPSPTSSFCFWVCFQSKETSIFNVSLFQKMEITHGTILLAINKLGKVMSLQRVQTKFFANYIQKNIFI